jgi:hypothetical protein
MRATIVTLLVISFCQAPAASASPERRMPFPNRPVFSVGIEDKDTQITDFSISPDGSKVVVGFETSDAEKRLKVRAQEWDLNTGKLIAKAPVGETIPAAAVGFASLFHKTIQYSPDGSKVIVRLGDNIYGLRSSNLSVLYSIVAQSANRMGSDPFSQVFFHFG